MLLRSVLRLAVLAAIGAAGVAVWLAVSPVLPGPYAWTPFRSGPAPAEAAPAPPPPRPAGLPARIPGWAWQLHAWMLHARHGARPAAAPHRVPAWFWTWRKWRLAVERH